MLVTVNVLERHIAGGLRGSSSMCMLGLAIGEGWVDGVRVRVLTDHRHPRSHYAVEFYNSKGDCIGGSLLPEEAIKAADTWEMLGDELPPGFVYRKHPGYELKPFSFELDIPEDFVPKESACC